MMKKITIILVDDHRIVRDGLRSLLQEEDDIDVIGTAESYDGLVELFSTIGTPDILILDISLPDISGIEVANIVSIKYPEIKIIMLSMYLNEDFIFNSLKAGAKGYLPKNTSKHELLEAIRQINQNQEYFTDEITNIILKSYLKKIKQEPEPNETTKLTRREEEIIRYVAEGLSNKDISDKLFISSRTVESHKNHIMNKLELKTNIDLIKFAIKNNIIQI
jgi:DNA-binding NarL/FixJ family response regulator